MKIGHFRINTLSKLNEFIALALCHPLVSTKLCNLLGGSYLYSFNQVARWAEFRTINDCRRFV